MENMTADEYRSRAREYELNEAKKGLIIHSAVTVVASVILAAVNLTFVPQFPWFIFPVLGMSIGVAVHYLFGVRLAPVFMDEKERRIENWR